MQVSQENIDQLNAIIRIDIKAEDYQPAVEKQLREYGRKASMPGFRPGKVPAGMIKKMYGKSVMLDEINKLTSDTLMNHIRENGLNILGQPLPSEENSLDMSQDAPDTVHLAFEIGLAPEFEPDLSKNHRFNLYMLQPDEQMLDEIVTDYRMRLGVAEPAEKAAKGDMLHGVFEELDAEGNVVEGGVQAHGDIREQDLVNSDAFLPFVGLSAGAELTIQPKELFKDEQTLARVLGLGPAKAEGLNSAFRFKVEDIKRLVPAELDQEFYDKVFGPGKASNEAEMRQLIADDLVKHYRKDAETRLYHEAVEHLVKNTSFDLPDSFMKKWLVANSEGKVSEDDIALNYENYARGIRWQLIEGKIQQANKIAVSQDDVLNQLTEDFLSYMGMAGTDDEDMRGRARQIASGMLKNEKEVNRIYDQLYTEAMTALFVNSFDVNEIALPKDKWIEQINAPIA
ncbi:MAG: trigger factor [Bacteroidia bacterium]|jgi:trigger factor|nr:trigger factor [Bacteroidia bacterium]